MFLSLHLSVLPLLLVCVINKTDNMTSLTVTKPMRSNYYLYETNSNLSNILAAMITGCVSKCIVYFCELSVSVNMI